jgi:short-subunit dehydrogenase
MTDIISTTNEPTVTANRSTKPVALITGASRGIGEAIARDLAQRGYALVLAARTAGDLTQLAGELSRSGAPALPVPADLRRLEDLDRLARLALNRYGRVDVVVHNAGISGMGKPFATTPPTYRDDILATNLIAPIELTRLLLPGMLARKSGSMIFIGSVAGHIGMPGSALYSTTKFGLRGFCDSLRREVAEQGVNVTLISPGFIATAMTTDVRVIPKASPKVVAQAVARAIERPRRDIVVPGWYLPFIWLSRTLPALADLVMGGMARAIRRPQR